MNARHILGRAIVLAGLLLAPLTTFAQTSNVVQDTFTGTSANLSWSAFNGACLTAGNGTGTIPACNGLPYYGNETQAGLSNNADTVGNGALRLTNGCVNGASTGPCYYDQNGAIISQTPFPSSQGVQVTFTTYAYSGNRGGSAGNGADGIGFYLIDPSKLPSSTNATTGVTTYSPQIGAWGGSLGYSCSNVNANYDGMLGGYIGLGMDEYGNYLNGAYESGYTGDNTATGQQATSTNGGNGQQYQPQRIGLRGYGNINLTTLKTYYSGATASNVQAVCKNGGSYTYPNGSYTVTYTQTYTYPPNGSYSTQTTTSVTLSTTSNSSSTQAACQGTTTSTTGGPGSTSGTALTYGGSSSQPIYQMSSSTSTSSPVTSTKTVKYKGNNYTCNTSTTTTTTTYSFTQAGATVFGASSSSSNGYTGTGTPFGVVNSSYYPLSSSTKTTSTANTSTAQLPDYPAIPNAYVNLPTTTPIANESAYTRANATPISYKLQVTQDGLLSLWYSYNGGTYTPVLTNQSIAASNGPMPSNFLFGFGGSTGGSDNVHEITCFLAQPANSSASSAGINIPQTGNVETGTYIYLAYYHTNNWWGQLTAQEINVNSTTGVPSIGSPKWDASCVLTGGTCTSTGSSTSVAPQSNRTLVTWSGGPGITNSTPAGIPFQWGRLTPEEQGWLSDNTSLLNGNLRANYLGGDRSEEFTSTSTTTSGIFRDRTSVLADIIHSSPAWVGGPNSPYPDTWKDLVNASDTLNENATSAQKYSAYVSSNATRLNVVYIGSNDGFLHAFEAGNTNSDGTFNEQHDDGAELMAYMPEAVLRNIHNNTTPALDYSSINYSHAYYVDSTAGTGDLFYAGAWHTWLASGLGTGGSAIFVLDVTNPTTLGVGSVIGEWSTYVGTSSTNTTTTLACTTDTSTSLCGKDLGLTTGTPLIRRLHNGEWGIIFGNGLNSVTGHAAIYVMTVNSSGSVDNVYFLDTGTGSATNPDGIAAVTAADLDSDHITDYVYAGDVYGNVWRFDLTSSTPANWAVTNYGPSTATSAVPLFTTPSTPWQITNSSGQVTSSGTATQPITTAVSVLSLSPASNGLPRLLIEFGTGQDTPQSVTTSESFAGGQQAIYGVWDWKLGVAGTPGVDYASLGGTAAPNAALTISQLTAQTVTSETAATVAGDTATGYRTVSDNTVCYVSSTCGTTAGTAYGWYLDLPGYNGVSGVLDNNQTEQVIYNPVEEDGALIVNTTIPANNSPLTCNALNATGWTMALDPATGGEFTTTSFFGGATGAYTTINGSAISGVALGLTGTSSIVNINGNAYLLGNAGNGGGGGGGGVLRRIYPPGSFTGSRLTWLQLH